jgi:serine/threonine protein kinase
MNERDLFIAALQIDSRAQRQDYLDEACGRDETLRQQVETLLAAHDRADGFLQTPVLVQVGAVIDLQDRTVESPSLSFLSPPLEPDELGRLGHYRVLRLLGQGGMGMVFLADDARLQRQVALKVMRPELASNPDSRQRFLREGRAAANIRSDHVVQIYHVDQEGKLPYLVMELLHGQSLAERLAQEQRLPLSLSLRITRETAEGLAAAHAAGLIHRDIKPANIWLEEPGGRVKLLDFGLARARTGPLITQRHVILGTPAYMAPEQAGGQPLDERCDLFSLGAVLYHMLTGQRPFAGEDLMAVLSSLAKGTTHPAAGLVPGLPTGVTKLLDSLLAKEPADRPASAAEVARTLMALEQDAAEFAPATDQKPSLVRTGIKTATSARRRRLAIVGGLGLSTLAIVLVVASLAGVFRGRNGNDQATAGGETPTPTALPNVAGPPALAEIPPAREFTLTGHDSQIQSLAFTADSKTLISAEYRQGKVLFWDVARHDEIFRMFTVPGGWLECLALDPHQHWLAASPGGAIGQKHQGIRLFHFSEREPAGELPGHTDRVTQLAFLKDGRTLVSTGYDGSIRCWDVEKQQEGKPLRERGSRIDCLDVWEDGKGGLRLALAGQHFASLNDVILEKFPYGPGRAAQSPDGTILACSKQERVSMPRMSYVTLWQLPGQTALGELPDAPKAEGLAFTPDSKNVIVTGATYTCIYEAATREQVARIEHPDRAVSLAVSPDGHWLAIGTVKGPIRVWHLPTVLAQPR